MSEWVRLFNPRAEWDALTEGFEADAATLNRVRLVTQCVAVDRALTVTELETVLAAADTFPHPHGATVYRHLAGLPETAAHPVIAAAVASRLTTGSNQQ